MRAHTITIATCFFISPQTGVRRLESTCSAFILDSSNLVKLIRRMGAALPRIRCVVIPGIGPWSNSDLKKNINAKPTVTS